MRIGRITIGPVLSRRLADESARLKREAAERTDNPAIASSHRLLAIKYESQARELRLGFGIESLRTRAGVRRIVEAAIVALLSWPFRPRIATIGGCTNAGVRGLLDPWNDLIGSSDTIIKFRYFTTLAWGKV